MSKISLESLLDYLMLQNDIEKILDNFSKNLSNQYAVSYFDIRNSTSKEIVKLIQKILDGIKDEPNCKGGNHD